MSKKLIIMVAAGGMVGFTAMFVVAWFTKTTPQSQHLEEHQETVAGQQAVPTPPQMQTPTPGAVATADSRMKKAMTEGQLKGLVYEVREKIKEYNSKLKSIEIREQRLKTARNTLKKDVDELNNLRIELSSIIATLKDQRDKLEKSMVEIAKVEKSNLISIAAAYDKMEPEAAGNILTNMSGAKDDSADDAVKILHYMSERTKAELLAALTSSEPKLAAYFCKRLKKIIEKE